MQTLIGNSYCTAVASSCQGHIKAAVAVDIDDRFIRAGDLSADGRGKAKAHRAKPAGADKLTRTAELIELSRPHLMLADAGTDDRVALGLREQFFDNVLRLDAWRFWVVTEGILLLPLGNLVKPFLARTDTPPLRACSSIIWASPTTGISTGTFLEMLAGSISI